MNRLLFFVLCVGPMILIIYGITLAYMDFFFENLLLYAVWNLVCLMIGWNVGATAYRLYERLTKPGNSHDS